MAMPHISDLRLFDSCVTLGRTCLAGVPELTVEPLLEVMDRHDIAEALVQSGEARLVYPRRRGNERLVKEVAGVARLHPVWALSPPDRPDPAGMRKLVDEMLSAGVRVARLMMGQVPPLHWMWRELCEALEERRVVCLVDFAPLRHGPTNHPGEPLMIDKLGEIAAAHPLLPLILSHLSGGLGVAAPTIPLMHRAPNLRIDTTGVVDYWRNVARGLGPQRIVFATGMPFYDPATFVGNVQYDETLDTEAKRLICGDNLRRLMEAVQ
ncbi:MAG TPA: amidohydrolase family protein [Phycisphaerae bacterium]|nr:amidohydrolase family protein [Phycisphaerae bacterium]